MTTTVKTRYLVVSSSWSFTLLLLLLLLSAKSGTCEALRENVRPRTGFSLKGPNEGIGGESKLARTSVQDAGVTYRPPIVNMNYFGGLVMWKPIHLYFIWYGKWSAAEKNLMRTVSDSLTPKRRIRQYPNLSNLWSIVTEYYQELPLEGRKHATNDVSIAGEVDDDYSFGNSISGDHDPLKIILSHLGECLPVDLEQGVYFLFTSADVIFSGEGYCGYHGNECVDPARSGTPFCNDYLNNIIYSFVPLPSVPNGLIVDCNIFRTTPTSGGLIGRPPNHLVSPHGALDSMVSTFLHELLETVVDPIWFLAESCPSKTVVMRKSRGTIQRGLFFRGSWLAKLCPRSGLQLENRSAWCKMHPHLL